MKYKMLEYGEWLQPPRRGHKHACCDCGLIHRMNFKLVKQGRGKAVQVQMMRDDRATAQMRRGMRRQRLKAST